MRKYSASIVTDLKPQNVGPLAQNAKCDSQAAIGGGGRGVVDRLPVDDSKKC